MKYHLWMSESRFYLALSVNVSINNKVILINADNGNVSTYSIRETSMYISISNKDRYVWSSDLNGLYKSVKEKINNTSTRVDYVFAFK